MGLEPTGKLKNRREAATILIPKGLSQQTDTMGCQGTRMTAYSNHPTKLLLILHE